MAVLMSYHRLIEKDSKRINYYWKSSVLVILCVSISSSVVIAFSLHSLGESFHQNCFMGAKLNFIKTHSSGLFSADRNVTCHSISMHPVDETCIIDELTSKWNNQEFCEYLTYTPLFHALIGVIWTALFVMHGPGGKGNGSIIAKPWRIVFPSFIFFILCAISAMICAWINNDALRTFCKEFNKVQISNEIDCAQMIFQFSLQHNEQIRPDKNYYLIAIFPWIWVASYVIGIITMLLRIILVADFQLIRVVISTIDKENESDGKEDININITNDRTAS
ncbi:uncharacterized protein LOC128744991 [Sabethes cyaneus]|uniref:uncharacterized protein LOC128744991 n=1 Tax=Sabethes cyaneus TaxID=53552 RepID=UPI00237DCE56|nr:uncharacterized protein LOC128744991 [Sabethes cyaneus]